MLPTSATSPSTSMLPDVSDIPKTCCSATTKLALSNLRTSTSSRNRATESHSFDSDPQVARIEPSGSVNTCRGHPAPLGCGHGYRFARTPVRPRNAAAASNSFPRRVCSSCLTPRSRGLSSSASQNLLSFLILSLPRSEHKPVCPQQFLNG